MIERKRTFGIVGLGNFGATVARDLTRYGNHVIAVDMDDRKVADLAEDVSEALIADGRDDGALREAGMEQCDAALVAMGSDLECSILTAVNLKMLGVGAVWAKAKSRTHHRILSKIGVDRVVYPEVEIGQNVAQVMHNPLVRDYMSLGNGFHVVNILAPEELNGKKLSEMKHRDKFDLRCVGVMRGTEFVGSDDDDATLKADDRLMLLGKRSDLRDFTAGL